MKENKHNSLLELFLCFLKIGAFTFGGGYAMIPLIHRETAHRRKWVTEEDILEIVAIAESTPGPIAINAATFIGYKTAGNAGAFLATLGVVLPSFIIITVIATILTTFENLKVVKYAFFGIRAGILALLINAVYMMFKKTKKTPLAYIVMIGAFILVAFLKINVLYVIIGCALLGFITQMIKVRRAKK